MNSKLPFEDAFERGMNNLPVPNEDESWQKMKQLLEEKDMRKPFVWLMRYVFWSAAILLLAPGLWLLTPSEKNTQGKQPVTVTNNNIHKEKDTLTNIVKEQQAAQSGQAKSNAILTDKPKEHSAFTQAVPADKIKDSQPAGTVSKNEINDTSSNENIVIKNRHRSTITKISSNAVILNKPGNHRSTLSQNNLQSRDSILEDFALHQQQLNTAKDTCKTSPNIAKNNHSFATKADSADSGNTSTVVAKDSLQQRRKDSSVSVAQVKPSVKKQKQYFIDAGIQVKQSLPLNGQQVTAYNFNGKHNMLTDYIPAVYVRLKKENRWYVQGEFSYVTPHLVKHFSYIQDTKANYTLSTVTTITYRLQKTFYSEIPISFHYYIRPDWSIGAGAMYSWFHSAVTEQETTINNAQSGIETVTKQIMPIKEYTDSFLYKAQAYLLLQTAYTANKWSFSLRYNRGIQPFIKYTLPNGGMENRSNSSLELLIHYRLFRSSKFSLKK